MPQAVDAVDAVDADEPPMLVVDIRALRVARVRVVASDNQIKGNEVLNHTQQQVKHVVVLETSKSESWNSPAALKKKEAATEQRRDNSTQGGQKAAALSQVAQAKWDELDVDGSGLLEGEEVMELAEFVWCSFRPHEVCTAEAARKEAAKILRRCDADDDGAINREEFEAYYETTATAMQKFQQAQAMKKEKQAADKNVMLSNEDHKKVVSLSTRADKKFRELDLDESGILEGVELHALAAWAWASFRPGEVISAGETRTETARILTQCDRDGSGTVSREEFGEWYEQTAEEIFKFKKEEAKKKKAAKLELLEMNQAEQKQVRVLSDLAQRKWDELDLDQSGTLEGEEILALSEWVWKSFRPSQPLKESTRLNEAAKILHRCDSNDDGTIDQEEFRAYYEHTAVAMFKYNEALAQKKKRKKTVSKMEIKNLSKAEREQVTELSEEAREKWDELDGDQNGSLEGEEVMKLAVWVWQTFRPGQEISTEARKKEAGKIIRRCDKNDDGAIDREEFGEYFVHTAAAMLKFNKALEAKRRITEEESAHKVSTPQEQRKVAILNDRALKKWAELDVDRSGQLEGEEILSLADWVWSSFRPGKAITSEARQKEAAKILRRCDTNADGTIDREEFAEYYETVSAQLIKFNEAMTKKKKAAKADIVELSSEERTQVTILTGVAKKKWEELDADRSGRLDGEEIMIMAEWVWSSFRPGKVVTDEERQKEAAKLLHRCDSDEDGSISAQEFSVYYEHLAAATIKYHEALQKKQNAAKAQVRELSLAEQKQVAKLSEAAQVKWEELDLDRSGQLDGEELMALAEWVWCGFHPDKQISTEDRRKEATKILRRCDANNDGGIDREEFEAYYEQTAAAMLKFQETLAAKKKTAKKPEPAVISAETQKNVMLLSAGAEMKWNELDVVSDGWLQGEEVLELAEWVWGSFHPGEEITPSIREAEAAEILGQCDVDGDGRISQDEFVPFYEKRCQELLAFREKLSKKQAQADLEVNELSLEEKQQVYVLSEASQAKWDELDTDQSGTLEGEEVMALAEFVWCSFRPGQSISADAKKKETLKVMRRCDSNDDGSISQEEFEIYYEQTAASMLKFQDALEKKKNSNTEKEKMKKQKKERAKGQAAWKTHQDARAKKSQIMKAEREASLAEKKAQSDRQPSLFFALPSCVCFARLSFQLVPLILMRVSQL